MEKRQARDAIDKELILHYVRERRRILAREGGRKLYNALKPVFRAHKIKLGRDKFFNILREHNLLVRKRKRTKRTTYSNHLYYKYPNIIKGMTVTESERVWVSDITYLNVGKGFAYLSLVTDLYSKRIMGYTVHPNLGAEGALKAMKQALRNRRYPGRKLIHHSDRGIQYCCNAYVKELKRNEIDISMSAHGDPYENSVAERVNGTLKTEFYLDGHYRTLKEARNTVKNAVGIYNTYRQHASCDYMTPNQAHMQNGYMKKRWKKYERKGCQKIAA